MESTSFSADEEKAEGLEFKLGMKIQLRLHLTAKEQGHTLGAGIILKLQIGVVGDYYAYQDAQWSDAMKIVTWNCNGAFRRKFHEIIQLKADIYVIQECENPERTSGEYRKWAQNYLWAGETEGRGPGIFASSSMEIRRLNWDDNGLQLFLPVAVNNWFNLVGVWTKQANSPTFRYIGQLWKYLGLYKQKMVTSHTVICGDLNSNKIWDLDHDRRWNHSAVV